MATGARAASSVAPRTMGVRDMVWGIDRVGQTLSKSAPRHRVRRYPAQLIFGPSPGLAGALSRRAPSELVRHSLRPTSTGLVGNSSGPSLRRPVAATRV